MSKELLVGKYDTNFIIKSTFLPNMDEKRNVIWVDDKKQTASGKNRVDGVMYFTEERDDYNGRTWFHQAWLSKEDIILLAEKIKEMEADEKIDKVPDDLPF